MAELNEQREIHTYALKVHKALEKAKEMIYDYIKDKKCGKISIEFNLQGGELKTFQKVTEHEIV